MTQDEYVELLKISALDIGKRAVMKALASRIPLLSGGLPAMIVGVVVEKILRIAILETEMQTFFWYIDMRVSAQGKTFSEYARAYHSATPEEKVKLESSYLDSFYKLASLKS